MPIQWKKIHPALNRTPLEWLQEHGPKLKNHELEDLWREVTGEIVGPAVMPRARDRYRVRLANEAWQRHFTTQNRIRKKERVTFPELPDIEPDGEAVFRVLCELQDENLNRLTARNTIDISIDVDRPIGLAYTADWHMGGQGIDYKGLDRDVDLINACPWLYAFVGGDVCENWVLDWMTEAQKMQSANVQQQWAVFRYVLERILPSVICVGDGNHPAWTRRVAGIDPTWQSVKDLPAVYTKEGGLLNLTIGEITYRIYRKHRPRFWSSYNPGHAVQQMWRFGECDFDIGVVEHHHVPNIGTFLAHNERKVWVRTGTYQVYSEYARSRGFYGAGPETPVVIFWPNEKRYHPILGLREAIDYLNSLGEA